MTFLLFLVHQIIYQTNFARNDRLESDCDVRTRRGEFKTLIVLSLIGDSDYSLLGYKALKYFFLQLWKRFKQ